MMDILNLRLVNLYSDTTNFYFVQTIFFEQTIKAIEKKNERRQNEGKTDLKIQQISSKNVEGFFRKRSIF